MKIRVFISSKQSELTEDRIAVAEAIERARLEPIFAETWAPRRASPEETYREDALRSPLYIGIFWRMYSAPTENEYRTSVSNRQTEILLYIRDCPPQEREEPLRRLLQEFETRHVCCTYSAPEELTRLVPRHLDDTIGRMVNRLHLLGQQTRSSARGGRLTPEELVHAWGLEGDAAEVIATLEQARMTLRMAAAS